MFAQTVFRRLRHVEDLPREAYSSSPSAVSRPVVRAVQQGDAEAVLQRLDLVADGGWVR
jgi:hypothetical protein